MTKIYLDDVRTPPDDSWILCINDDEFEMAILTHYLTITEIAFDHDLGMLSRDGAELSNELIQMLVDEVLEMPELVMVTCHSGNPSGAENILGKWKGYADHCQPDLKLRRVHSF